MSRSLSIFGLNTRGEDSIKGLVVGPDGVFEEFFYNDGYEFRNFWPNDIEAESPVLHERVCMVVWDSGPNLFVCLSPNYDNGEGRHVPHVSCWTSNEIIGALGMEAFVPEEVHPLEDEDLKVECAS